MSLGSIANRKFWYTFVAGLAMVVLGYFGFLASMPDKTSYPFLDLLCFLVLGTGVLVLVGSLGFAISKIVVERRRSKWVADDVRERANVSR